MKTVRGVLASTGDPSDWASAAVSEEVKVMKPATVAATRPQSYAKAASKRGREWARPTIRELEAPMKTEDKQAPGLKALQWKPLKPINKRLIRPGQPLKEGSLKKKVETTKFVYIGGMTRQPFGVVRAALRAAGVDTKKIYDISFAGKQVGSLLTDIEYSETIERVLTAGKSTMKILKDFDPLSPSLLKKTPLAGANVKAPVELYARRAAFAASKSRSLLVATKYQQALKEEQFDIFKRELDMLMESRTKKNKGKPKKHTKTNIMEVDTIKGVHIT